jgi:hypothetical protein
MANRNALDDTEIRWLQVKEEQREHSYFLALIDSAKLQQGSPIEYFTADCQSVGLLPAVKRTRGSFLAHNQEFPGWCRAPAGSPFCSAHLWLS